MRSFAHLLLSILLLPLPSLAEIGVGVVLPLSGGTAVWGEGIKRGLELADRAHPGVFEFIYEDEQFCDSKIALTAAKKLIELDRVQLLITGCLNGTKVIAPLADKAGIPILSAGLLDEASLSQSHEIISLSGQIGSEGVFLANYLKAKNFKRVAIFRHDDSFTAEFKEQLAREIAKTGGPNLEDYAVIDASFPWSSKIAQAKQDATDGFLVYLGNDELINFMKARAQLKDSTPVLSGYIIESNFSAKEFGTSLSGIRYSYPRIAPKSDRKRQSFEALFSNVFGASEIPSVNAYFVFDGVETLANALERCTSVDFACIWPQFENAGQPHSGVSGTFQFLRGGAVERSFELKEVRDSSFIKVVDYEAAS